MYTKNIFAAGALLSVAAAVPMANKRDVVWVTETAEDVVTVPVTTTVWVNPGESVSTAASSPSHYGHHHHSQVTTHVQSTVTVPSAPSSPPAPASSEESSSAESNAAPPAPSSYVAPTTSTTEAAPTTPSSTSVYVAPTTPSTTSVYVAPTTSSTSEYVAPSPTSTYVEPTTSTSAAPAYSTTASSGSGSLTGDAAPGTEYSGDLTWYDVGMGACGLTSVPSDHIVAIAESLFDEYTPTTGIHAGNPNDNSLCGKTLTITGVDGSPYTATIVDRCGGCKKEDLDLSQDFFNAVTNNGDGRVHNMSWKFD